MSMYFNDQWHFTNSRWTYLDLLGRNGNYFVRKAVWVHMPGRTFCRHTYEIGGQKVNILSVSKSQDGSVVSYLVQKTLFLQKLEQMN